MTARRAMLLLALTVFGTPSALAETAERRWTASVSGEGHSGPDPAGHGAVLVATERLGRAGQSVFVEINTDTLRVGATNLPVASRLRLHAVATAEALVAGLQPDFWQQDRLDAGAGFFHSYARGDVALDVHLRRGHQITPFVGGGVRGFGAMAQTRDAFTSSGDPASLPDEYGFAEAGARYTWWGLADDDAWSDRHRFYPRLVGSAVDVSIAGRVRSQTRPWSLSADPQPERQRNTPAVVAATVSARALSGMPIGRSARLQLEQRVVATVGLDDTERPRVGGMNPWVVPVAGLPWASHVPNHVAAQRASLHLAAGRGVEVGPIVDVAWIDDIDRTGGAAGIRGGVGAFVDARLQSWQVDTRIGYAPPSEHLDAPGRFTLFVGVGRAWRRDAED